MRSKAPWLLLALGVLFATPGLWLATRNGSFAADGPFIFLSIVVMAGWATVGAMLASRNPSNPIGWLMLVFGTGFSALALAEEWATYAYETNPGALPFRSFALWLSNWAFIALITPVPLILLLYPSGHVRSPRWRWVLWAALLATAFGCVGSLLQTNPIELNSTSVPNPTGVKALEGLAGALQAVAGLSWILALVPLCIASVVLRFRHARDEERQQIRWLAYVAAVGGVSFFTAILSGFGLGPNETSFVNEASFYLFFIAFGIGFPGAIGVALLKYRLWDLDIVLKKTLVAAIVVTLLTVLATAVLLLAGGILVGPVADEPGLLLVVGLVAGVLVWPVLRFARRVADRLVYGGRATPYEVLTDFSDRMAETYSTDDVLPRMAAILGEGTGAENATIWLLVGGDLRPAARWPAGADPDEPRPATMLADVDPNAFEVRHQGEVLGAITVTMPANDPMNPAKGRLIHDLAGQAGLVLRNVRLIEDVRESRRRIVAAEDEGRRRLERNIHDGAQQQLVALAVKLRLADTMVESDPVKAHELLAQLQTETTDALEDLRDLARGIYPPLLADKGLAAALESQARKVPVPVEVAPDGVGRYPQDVEAAIYFCCLEALQNIAKYADASRVHVRLSHEGERLAFEVRDDGRGFDATTVSRGIGLQGMTDRLEAIGGELEVVSAPGAGTRVAGSVPVGVRREPGD